jgi:hypothetical protein
MPTDTNAGDPGRWTEGAETIQDMIDDGLLDSGVYVNPADVDALFDDAETHLDSANNLKDNDPRAAYSVMYTGARKALVAALLKQGLRARGGEGGHPPRLRRDQGATRNRRLPHHRPLRPDAPQAKPSRLRRRRAHRNSGR